MVNKYLAGLLATGAVMIAEGASTPLRAQDPTSSAPAPSAPDVGVQPTSAQRLIDDFSPKMVELTDNVLFGDVWERPELSKRDRSLVTVSALIAMNRPDQLRSHLAKARGHLEEPPF
jgi:4-carboxymuconolactone decarboxylase